MFPSFFLITLDSGLEIGYNSIIMNKHIVVSKPTYIHTLIKSRSC